MRFLLAAPLILFAAAPVQAQAARPDWPPLRDASVAQFYPARVSATSQQLGDAADTTVRVIKPTYWKEGGFIGAVPLAIATGWLANGLCGIDDSATRKSCTTAAVGGAAIGAGVGFLIGALIGGQFYKNSKAAEGT